MQKKICLKKCRSFYTKTDTHFASLYNPLSRKHKMLFLFTSKRKLNQDKAVMHFSKHVA